MKPVLSKQPPMRRTVLFGPVLFGLFLVTFLVLGFATDLFLLSLLVSLPLALAGAVALLGWPQVTRKDGSPLVPPRWKPFLFFPLAPLLALLFYPLVGAVVTMAGVPPAYIAWLSLAVALPAGIVLAYFLVGFPRLWSAARAQYERVPRERRPFLFFPLFVVFFVIIYFGLGVGTTQAMKGAEDTSLLLNLQVLVLLPVSLALAALGAWLLVGIPKPSRSPTEYLPKVTGRHRPLAFFLTFLVVGLLLTVAVGAGLTVLASRSSVPLPSALVLPLGVLLGFSLSLGITALAWGTPARWRQYEDYRPGIPPRARLPLYLGTALAVAIVVTAIFGLAGADIFWGILTGALLGLIVGLQLAGIMGRIAARRRADSLVPDLPDGIKPLVLFPTWFLLAGLLFAILTYTLPELVAWNALASLVLGLLVAFFLVEQPLWKDLREDRRRERERRKAFEARRKQALDELRR